MKNIKKLLEWIKDNTTWLFSGIGVTAVMTLLSVLFSANINKNESAASIPIISPEINISGDVYQDDTINYNFNIGLSINMSESEKTKSKQNESEEVLTFQHIIDFEKKKHWTEKSIVGIQYNPSPSVLKWIASAKDFTYDWDIYRPYLLYDSKKTIADNAGLVGKTENFLLYDISMSGGSMLIKTSDDSYILADGIPSTTSAGEKVQPSIMEYDYDNDGDNELAIRVHILHGTGVSIDSLFMVDKAADGKWYIFHFLYTDYLDTIYKICSSTSIDDYEYLIWDDSVIEILPKTKNGEHKKYYYIGDIIDIEYSFGEILLKLGVGHDLNDYRDYSSGHGISAKVRYLGDGKWELSEYDYYNDLLESYVTWLMDSYLISDEEVLTQKCDFTFPEFYQSVTEYDIVKILYDYNKFGNDSFRVDVLFNVNDEGITYHAILTIKQVEPLDNYDAVSHGIWKICDFQLTN